MMMMMMMGVMVMVSLGGGAGETPRMTPVATDRSMPASPVVSAAPMSAAPVSAAPMSAAPMSATVVSATVSAPGEGLGRGIVRGESGQSEHQDRNRSNRQFAKHCRVLPF
jgi:hypothetical protein